MTKREVAFLACKLLAINFFILMVPIAMFQIKYGGGHLVSIIATIAASILLPLILWLLAKPLSHSMITLDGVIPQDSSNKATNWYVIASSVLGFLVLFRAIPNISSIVMNIVTQLFQTLQGQYSAASFSYVSDSITAILYIVVGLWLILGSRGLVEMLNKKSQPAS